MTFDIAIIGAGIAGASLAWSLGRQSGGRLRVALIEMESAPGYHTTGRSAAFWVESYGGPGVVPLSRASRAFFMEPPPGFAAAPLLSPRPGLTVAPPDDAGDLDTLAAAFDAGGTVYRRLDAEALTAWPILKPEWRTRGLFEPDSYDIDVAALHQGYLRGVDGWKPAVITDAAVSAIARDGDGWTLATRAGPITATIVVNAAGAWADGVAALAGARPLGLQPLRRTMAVLAIDPPPPADLPVVFDARGRFYCKPDGGRLWLSPHDETPDVPHDVRPDEMDLAVVIDQFEQASTARVVRLDSSWAGLRTFAPDRLPVFGWDGAVAGLFWCAGQGGFGIQTAPAAGQLCAALLLGEAPAVDPAPYRATRFERID
ncbi:NAD(P)/FAD-dependent oxidoreductase [Polymorphobacter fuscus]|uniref:FAD-dependent oxidoreductase n=1 Tax=Sandarakinorhabdus fusca TaxID=1439888 RepID=A0A7C9GZD8_9SPHN|nr:FAD-binding oxidoreductase [Polymorphobacter fuscus]KAB7644128.1 FAD-binding oxidoreductase [Polymorphobacter fuscus]MQT18514.1 FAD-dependent oxidoreductase [Polymorphobacter fuscus]NJC08363.1 D-arginine dehydrogenase [Polymorphobacter fuscus]